MCVCVDVNRCKIVNIYKPLPTRLQASNLLMLLHSCLYAGDFNYSHNDWCNGADEECLADWESSNSIALLYNSIESTSLHSDRWNTGYNRAFAFASVDSHSRLPNRCVQKKLPDHQSSVIIPPRFALLLRSALVKP